VTLPADMYMLYVHVDMLLLCMCMHMHAQQHDNIQTTTYMHNKHDNNNNNNKHAHVTCCCHAQQQQHDNLQHTTNNNATDVPVAPPHVARWANFLEDAAFELNVAKIFPKRALLFGRRPARETTAGDNIAILTRSRAQPHHA
jgi:hypothetical protein